MLAFLRVGGEVVRSYLLTLIFGAWGQEPEGLGETIPPPPPVPQGSEVVKRGCPPRPPPPPRSCKRVGSSLYYVGRIEGKGSASGALAVTAWEYPDPETEYEGLLPTELFPLPFPGEVFEMWTYYEAETDGEPTVQVRQRGSELPLGIFGGWEV